MADSEVEKLKARVEELEQQLAEERDEFEWDLKAAKESSNQTIHKLEDEIKRMQQAGADASAKPAGEPGKPGDVKLLTQRALMAERRVAELQEELKRASQLTPAPAPKGDPLLRQRAEAAERERDELRKEKRALERSVEEKRASIERFKKDQEETRGLKRQLEGAKKDLAEKEKDLRKARDAAAGQGDLSAELDKKEAKIGELAQELNNLAAVEVERDSLLKELDQLRVEAQEQQPSPGEADSARVGELEAEVERLKQELAQVQVASGQMVEQRERETARLKADLQEVSEKEATFAGQTDQMKRELTRLRDELVVTARERDELVAQLRSMREDQETGVYRMGSDDKEQADLFSEDTQATAQPRGADGSAHLETVRNGEPLPPVGEAEELFPEDGFVQEEVTQKGKPSFAQGVTRRAEVPPAPTEDAASEDELAPPAVDSVPLAKVDVEPSGETEAVEAEELEPAPPDLLSPADEDAPEQTMDVRTDRGTRKPSPDSLRVAQPKGKRGFLMMLLKIVAGGVLVGGLVGGSYYFFPKWFGLGDDGEGEVVVEAADAGSAQTDAGTEPDAGAAVAPPVVADAGVPEEAADQNDIEQPEEPEEPEVPVGPKEPTPKMKKAQAFATRLLAKRKIPKALKFLEGWVQKEPSDPTFRVLFGRAKAARKWYKAASEELEKAIELDPGMAEAYYQLGGVYIRMQDVPKACQALKKYVELAPKDRRTPAVKKNIRKLKCPE